MHNAVFHLNRRDLLIASLATMLAATNNVQAQQTPRLRQSVARWCFAQYDIDTLCKVANTLGITGMDLAAPNEWATCQSYGITPLMVQGGGGFRPAQADSNRRFGKAFGWNNPAHHAELLASIDSNGAQAAAAGVHSMIGLFGDREGISDDEGISNCITGLKLALPLLEKYNLTLSLELLNSIVDHPDYQGDNTAFGAEVCKAMASERINLVYDIYHMQIMEGNLIATIRENIQWIGHFHVAGVPGRNEINESQEVNWRAVAAAIANLGFNGFVAHEWIPTGSDPLQELAIAAEILRV